MMLLHAAPLRELDGVRHGFFTRLGGLSEGPFASLNCGFGADDDPAKVAENRSIAMARFELPADALCTAYQRHGNRCITVAAPWKHGDAPRADAMVTDRPGLALGVLTADCAPVLFADPISRVIGAAHAGWRGALAGVVDAAVAAMAALGAEPENIVAAIGPCIGPGSYEVGPDLRDPFVAAGRANAAFFAPAKRKGHHMFDLPGYVAARLGALGLARVATLAHDTRADAERFFSYRRATLMGERDHGRLLSAIALAEN